MTCVLCPNFFSGLAVDCGATQDKQFLAWLDGGECINGDAVARFIRLAVARTCMVQKAGTVATATAVDHTSVGKAKRECVPNFQSLSCSGPPSAGHFAFVIDKPLASGNGLQRKDSVAMH
jgi:hypothetical protein